MNEQSIPRPVAEMLLAMERNVHVLWPLAVIRDLESQARGQAMLWACAVVESQLPPLTDPELRSQRQQWLADLRRRAATHASLDDAARISREVWYYGSARDTAQTAIARLYEALSGLANEDASGYCKAIATAVIVATSASDGRPSPATLTTIIDLYNELRRTGGANAPRESPPRKMNQDRLQR